MASSWTDLDPGVRRALIAVGTVEGALKLAALVDLARRPAADVRGRKGAWAAAVILINAGGAAPLAYLRWGRK